MFAFARAPPAKEDVGAGIGEPLGETGETLGPPGLDRSGRGDPRVHRDPGATPALREQGLDSDPAVRRVLSDLAVEVMEVEMYALRVLDALQRGQTGVVEAAANKVFQSEVCQRIARSAFDFGGPEALTNGARVNTLWRQSLWETIGGGTSEMMRSLVARRGLGLGGRS